MKTERLLRTTADLQPGDHACCLWQNKRERRAAVGPFLRQGLERGEKVLYFVDAASAKAGRNRLRDIELDVEPYLIFGQLEVRVCQDTYMQEGVFDPDRMIALLRTETEQALDEGYTALRVTGEMTWALQRLPGSERLLEYEAKLNNFFLGSNCSAICQYEKRAFSHTLLTDALATHPIFAVGTKVYDEWMERPAEQYRREDELEYWKQILDIATQGIPESVFFISKDRTILWANAVAAKEAGYEAGELLGRHCYEVTHRRDSPCEPPLHPCPISMIQETGQPQTTRHTHFSARGGKTLVEVSTVPVKDGKGELLGLAHVSESVSQRWRLEDALSTVREALENSVERRLQRRNVYRLTSRQLTVLRLLTSGKSSRDIATILGITYLTAEKHISNILGKIGVASRTAAVARAIKEGLVD